MEQKRLKPIKGLTPQKSRKIHYLFAESFEDFANYTGMKPLKLKFIGGLNEKFGSFTENDVYVYCNKIENIRGLKKIQVIFTELFKDHTSVEKLKLIETEIQICNFESTSHFNPEHIPNVLKQAMAEHAVPGSQFCFPVVGMVVKTKKDYPPIGVKKGDTGIIISLSGPKQTDAGILFSNGSHAGFTYEEILDEDIKFCHLSNHQHIKNYKHENITKLFQDFEDGHFDVEFYNLED